MRAKHVLALAVVAAAACGGGRSSGPTPSEPPPPDSGSPGGGSPPGGGGDGGGGAQPPAGGGPGAGGGTPSACDGLAPAFASDVELKMDTGTHRACSVATANGSGQVALGVSGSFTGTNGTVFSLYSADGLVHLGDTDEILQTLPSGTTDVDPWFHPTAGGYQGIVHPGNTPPLPFRTWNSSGHLVAEVEPFSVSSAPDRQGGSLLLAVVVDPVGGAPTPGPTRLLRVDAAGRVTRLFVVSDRAPALVISNWTTGHIVVVAPGSPGTARWFDENGSPITPWFDVGKVIGTSIHLLVDGTIVFSNDGQWQVALPDGASSSGSVPAWLASRPSTRVATIRGGRAYAVLGTADAGRFEIVTSAGESCGSFSIPAASVGPGETKTPTRLDVGADGTLIQTSSLSLSEPSFGIHCTFRWWPGLLK